MKKDDKKLLDELKKAVDDEDIDLFKNLTESLRKEYKRDKDKFKNHYIYEIKRLGSILKQKIEVNNEKKRLTKEPLGSREDFKRMRGRQWGRNKNSKF